MFAKLRKGRSQAKAAPVNLPKNLTKEEYKQISEIVETARRNDGIPRTAQQSIPFQRMFADGICRVTDNYYTKTIQVGEENKTMGLEIGYSTFYSTLAIALSCH